MRILLINNNHRLVGGAERYYLDLFWLLKSNGHKVAFFSMKDPKNIKTKWSNYFVSNINLEKSNLLQKILRVPYSFESRRKINKVLDVFKPDIVHINNIYYYITPSILPEIKRRNIPIIQTVHDYQLISPVSALFYDGKVCEITKTSSYYKALLDRSKKPYMTTIISVISQYVQYFFKFFEKNVDCYIVPSQFMKNKLLEYKFKAKKIVHLPNFSRFSLSSRKKYKNINSEKFVLFFGRLDESKGVLFLLKVAEKLPDIKFKIIGNYTNSESAKKIQDFLNTKNLKNIIIEPHQNDKTLLKNLSKCRIVIVPSLWYENQPYSVIESLFLGKAVVASKIGGIPEIITDKKSGLLFKAGNIDDCVTKITTLWNNPKLLKRLEKGAKVRSKDFTPNIHYKMLLDIYKKAISRP
jgi:glycosyltransferase involved in cell wall biosynthesis